MSDVDDLIREARAFGDRDNGLDWPGRVRELADALEVQQSRIRELEADRDEFLEQRNEYIGFEKEVRAERDAFAAVIEKMRAANDDVIWSHRLREILDTAPADVLREHDADVIREAAGAIRRNATAPSELIYPTVQIDALIAWVADWIENPPEWVHVSWRTEKPEDKPYLWEPWRPRKVTYEDGLRPDREETKR